MDIYLETYLRDNPVDKEGFLLEQAKIYTGIVDYGSTNFIKSNHNLLILAEND